MIILSIDDHELFRCGLKHLIKGIDDEVVFHEAETAEAAIGMRDVVSPELIILDYFLPNLMGVKALALIREAFERSVVVVVSSLDEASLIREAIENGAAGFIPKSSSQSVLVNALKLTLAGGIYLPRHSLSDITQNLLTINKKTSTGDDALDGFDKLTFRQKEILKYVLKGMPNKNIAAELNICEGTVKSHLSTAYRLLKINNRTQAVILLANRYCPS